MCQALSKCLAHKNIIFQFNKKEMLFKKKIDKVFLEQEIISVLKTVFDPEIPVDIYELGLIYGIKIDNEGNTEIIMTLTAPACPVAGTLPGEVKEKIKNAVKELNSVEVKLVWEPAWNKDMMSDEAKLNLGFF